LQQGENAINSRRRGKRNAFSTSTLAGLDQFAQGTASNQYNNYTQQLLSLAGLGGSATAGTSASGTAAAEGASNSLITAAARMLAESRLGECDSERHQRYPVV